MAKEKAPEKKEKPGKAKEDDKKPKKERKFPPRKKVWKDHKDKSNKRVGPTAQQAAKIVQRSRRVKLWDRIYRKNPRFAGHYYNPFMAWRELRWFWKSVRLPTGRLDIERLWSSRKLFSIAPGKRHIYAPMRPLTSQAVKYGRIQAKKAEQKKTAKPEAKAAAKPAAKKDDAAKTSKGEKAAKPAPKKTKPAKWNGKTDPPRRRNVKREQQIIRNQKRKLHYKKLGQEPPKRKHHTYGPVRCAKAARKIWCTREYIQRFGPYASQELLVEFFKGKEGIPDPAKMVQINYKTKINFYGNIHKGRNGLNNKLRAAQSKAPAVCFNESLSLKDIQGNEEYGKFIQLFTKKPVAEVNKLTHAYIILLLRDHCISMPGHKDRVLAFAK